MTLVVATNTAPEAVAPGTANAAGYTTITVNDGPDGGDIDPLTRRGTGVVNLRGISHDADGDALIHNWTELDMATDTSTGNDVVPTSAATFPRPIRPPAKPHVTIDGAFSQDASFTVPEVNAQHPTISVDVGDRNGDGDSDDPGEGTQKVLHVPIAFTVLDQWQVKTTKIVIVRIVNNDDIPRANAGPSQQVTPGSFVRLNGAGSSDSDPGDKLSYAWTYIGIETDPLTQNRRAITPTEVGLGYVEGKWFPYDDENPAGTKLSVADQGTVDQDTDTAGDQTTGTYHPTAGGALKNEDTAFPYFDAPRLGGFSSIKLKFNLVVTDGAATTETTDDNPSVNTAVVTITITDGFYSGNVTGPDFCLVQSLGGPTTYPFDSNFDGVADTCSLNTTRRATVARQNALETLAALNPDTFKDHLHGKAAVAADPSATPPVLAAPAIPSQCAQAPRNLGDSAGDLVNDSCGRVGSFNRVVSAPPRPVDPAKADEFFSGVITGPNFCANNSLGGATTYAFDSDGDGVADICSLPFTRREAVARQNALNAAFSTHDQYDEALAAACAALGSTDFGDSAGALATDHCSRPPAPTTGTALPTVPTT